MARILIIDDEPAMLLGLKDNLEMDGYEVETAADGDDGLKKIRTGGNDLILLDVMMPKISGFDVCRTARQEGVTAPIILLTARGEEIDKVLGLELGADDYITKPFSVRELLARVKAILRRAGKSPSPDHSTAIGRLRVDFQSLVAAEGDKEVRLSHKEFEILAYLLKHRNEVVSRRDLLEKVWGYEEQPTTRTVDNFIVRLRNKVEINPNQPRVILTVHGTGYRLVV